LVRSVIGLDPSQCVMGRVPTVLILSEAPQHDIPKRFLFVTNRHTAYR
jgi:hypothetical protein